MRATLWVATAFVFLVLSTLASFYDRFPADERIAHAVQGIDVPAFGGFIDFVNWVGNPWPASMATVALALAVLTLRAVPEALLLLLTFLPRILNSAIQEWVGRPRPSGALVSVTEQVSAPSFPSGHTVGTTVFFGLLFVLLPHLVPPRPLRWPMQAACLLAVVAAGPARVYAGVHWPSDVLAGYLLALLFVLPAAAAYRSYRGGRSKASASERRGDRGQENAPA